MRAEYIIELTEVKIDKDQEKLDFSSIIINMV